MARKWKSKVAPTPWTKLSPLIVRELKALFGTNRNIFRNLKLADAGISYAELSDGVRDRQVKLAVALTIESRWNEYKETHQLEIAPLPDPPKGYAAPVRRRFRQDEVILEMNEGKPFKFLED